MMLVWNEVERGWECSECGALYSDTDVERVFGFDSQIPENFAESYCMDCGCKWHEVKV